MTTTESTARIHAGAWRLNVLGPVELCYDDHPVEVTGLTRTLLALLARTPGEEVTTASIAAGIWGSAPPEDSEKEVASNISRLRRALTVVAPDVDPTSVVVTMPAGYILAVEPANADILAFERLAADGERALAVGQPTLALTRLDAALALWRGRAYADFDDHTFVSTEAARLEDLRLAVIESSIAARLAEAAPGAPDELLTELPELLTEHWHRERLWIQWMTVLFRVDRRPDALAAFQRAEQLLGEQLSASPGPDLRATERAVKASDQQLYGHPITAAFVPAALATTVPACVGREEELAWLSGALDLAATRRAQARLIVGAPGIGKTRIVAELAQRAASRGVPAYHWLSDTNGLDAFAPDPSAVTLVVIEDLDLAGHDDVARVTGFIRANMSRPVVTLLTCRDPVRVGDLASLPKLVLSALDDHAIADIVRVYAPAVTDGMAVAAMTSTGGIPARIHRSASEWAFARAGRRIDRAVADSTEPTRRLATLADEVVGGVLDLAHVRAQARPLRPAVRDVVARPYKGLSSYEAGDADLFHGREHLVAELVSRLMERRLLAVVGDPGTGKSSLVRAGLLPALASGVLPTSARWRQVIVRPGVGGSLAEQMAPHLDDLRRAERTFDELYLEQPVESRSGQPAGRSLSRGQEQLDEPALEPNNEQPYESTYASTYESNDDQQPYESTYVPAQRTAEPTLDQRPSDQGLLEEDAWEEGRWEAGGADEGTAGDGVAGATDEEALDRAPYDSGSAAVFFVDDLERTVELPDGFTLGSAVAQAVGSDQTEDEPAEPAYYLEPDRDPERGLADEFESGSDSEGDAVAGGDERDPFAGGDERDPFAGGDQRDAFAGGDQVGGLAGGGHSDAFAGGDQRGNGDDQRVAAWSGPEEVSAGTSTDGGDAPTAGDVVVPGQDSILLVVDQFEEVFTLLDPPARADFLATVVELAATNRVILTLRGDFYGRCAENVEFAGLLTANTVLMRTMTVEEICRVVEAPAAAAGLVVEDGLAEQIAAEASGLPGLAHLSSALHATWENRAAGELTVAAYRASGGVARAVTNLAENAYSGLATADERDAARRILLCLTAASDADVLVGRRVSLAEVIAAAGPAAPAVLEKLVASRLVTASDGTVELVHDVVLEQWPRVRQWLADARAYDAQRRHLTEAAMAWGERDDPAALYRGARLATALDLIRGGTDDLSQGEHEFLAASQRLVLAADIRRKRRVVRLWRYLVAAIAVAVLAILVAGAAVALQLRSAAADERTDGQKLASLAVAEPDLRKALLLAVAASQLDDDSTSSIRNVLLGSPDVVAAAGHDVTTVALSPDGSTVAAASVEGTIWLYSADTLTQTGRLDLAGAGPVNGLAFTVDGRRLISWGGSRTTTTTSPTSIVVWDLASKKPVGRPFGQAWPDAGGGLLTDGDTLLLAQHGSDPDKPPTAVAWSIEARTPSTAYDLPTTAVDAMQLSPDGGFVAIGTPEGTRVVDLKASSDRLISAASKPLALSRDGRTLLTADGSRVAVWDLATGSRTGEAVLHSDEVLGAAWAPDGSRFASVGADGLVIVWETATLRPVKALVGHGGSVLVVRFGADGEMLYTVGADGSLFAWDLTGSRGVGARADAEASTLLPLACTLAGRDLTQQEWRTYLPDRSYRHVCPT